MPTLKWHPDHNHVFDSVPLQLVRIANESLNFQWLIVSDGDTCFNVAELTDRLKKLNSSNP